MRILPTPPGFNTISGPPTWFKTDGSEIIRQHARNPYTKEQLLCIQRYLMSMDTFMREISVKRETAKWIIDELLLEVEP